MLFKKIIREIVITGVLVAIVLLLLGIALYKSNPITKEIPNAVAYQTSESLSKEISTQLVPNDTKVIVTYQVDNNDLNNAEDYDPGKKNPFVSYSNDTENTDPINGGNNNNSNNSNNSSNNTNGSGSANSVLFPNNSIK